jgi:hypothetical protein
MPDFASQPKRIRILERPGRRATITVYVARQAFGGLIWFWCIEGNAVFEPRLRRGSSSTDVQLQPLFWWGPEWGRLVH